MDAVLTSQQLPQDCDGLLELSRSLWKSLSIELRQLSSEELKNWISRSFQYLLGLTTESSNENIQKIVVGLSCVYHFCRYDVSQIELLLPFVYTATDHVSVQFAAKTVAKIALEFASTEENFGRRQLESGIDCIKLKHHILMGLSLIYEIACVLPITFLVSSQDIPDLLWPWLINHSSDIRAAAQRVLKRYLVVIVKYQGYGLVEYFDSIYQRAVCHLLNTPTDCPQGVLAVLHILLTQNCSFFQSKGTVIFNTVRLFIDEGKTRVRGLATLVLAALSSLDKDKFKEIMFDVTFAAILRMARLDFHIALQAMTMIISNVGFCIVPEIAYDIYQMFEFSLHMKYKQSIPEVIDALILIADHVPWLLKSDKFDAWKLASPYVCTESFLLFFRKLVDGVDNFWGKHSVEVCDIIFETLTSPRSDVQAKRCGLKLIPQLPQLLQSQVNSFMAIMRDYMFISNEVTRSLVPKAYLRLIATMTDEEKHHCIQQIIEIATGDDSTLVRAESLRCFRSRLCREMAHPQFMVHYQTLAHDIDPVVRSACYELLEGLNQYTPLRINVILRHAIIDSFYSLKCAKVLPIQLESAKSLPALVSSSPGLFEVYASTCIPIILDMLQDRYDPKSFDVYNPFDYPLRSELAMYLLQTLRKLVAMDYRFLQPFLVRFNAIASLILEEHDGKKLKIEIISMISDYVSQAGTSQEIIGNNSGILPAIFSLIEKCNSRRLRIQALRFMGLCGAISSKKLRGGAVVHREDDQDLPDLFLVGNVTSYNDYFLQVAFKRLNDLLEDKSLADLRIRVVSTAIESLNIRSTAPGEYFPKLLHWIMKEIKTGQTEEGFRLLRKFISVAGQRTAVFVHEIMAELKENWKLSLIPSTLSIIAALIEQVETDFSPYAGQLIGNLLDVLSSAAVTAQPEAIQCVPLLAQVSIDFPHLAQLLIPQLCSLVNSEQATPELKIAALDALRWLVQHTKNPENMASIWRVIIDACLCDNELVKEGAFQVLYSLIIRLGPGFDLYSGRTVQKLTQYGTLPREYGLIASAIMSGKPLDFADFPFISTADIVMRERCETRPSETFNERTIRNQFNHLADMKSPKHWQNWFNGFILVCIRESPSVSIRACHELASIHRPLAVELFYPAFLSCWIMMSDDGKDIVSLRLSMILDKSGLPSDVVQCISRLCEYMDRAEKPLRVSHRALTQFYIKSQCSALALHNEQEMWNQQSDTSPDLMETVIKLYSSLGKTDAAKALLASSEMSDEWLLRLGEWRDALKFFKEKLEFFPDNGEGFVGYIASCGKLRKFDMIRNAVDDFHNHDKTVQAKAAQDFVDAFFFSGEYKKMLQFSEIVGTDSVDGHISQIIAHLKLGQNEKAEQEINTAFGLVASQSAPLFGRRYETVYPAILRCQILYELLEIAEKGPSKVPRQQWMQRIRAVEYKSEVWWPLIIVRSLTEPRDDIVLVHFLELILHERKYDVFESTFKLFFPNLPTADTLVKLQYLKYKWATGERQKALSTLERMVDGMKFDSNVFPRVMTHYVDWTLTIAGRNSQSLLAVIKALKPVLMRSQQNHDVWERWAAVNYHMYGLQNTQKQYAVEAIKGYIHCIASSGHGSFSEIVQLLSLFFATASDATIRMSTFPLLRRLPSSLFVDSIPQLVAQLSHANDDTVGLVQKILTELSASYYQSIIFPLLVAQMSPDKRKCEAASGVLDQIAVQHSEVLMQAKIMQNSYLQSAVTLFEQCLKWILEYFEHPDRSDEILQKMLPRILDPRTSIDRVFHQINYLHIPKLTKATYEHDLDSADAILREMLIEIEKFLDKMNIMSVIEVCPELSKLTNTDLWVPGAPRDVKIQSYGDSFEVLGSKKRPRKARIIGSDGITYKYLLKGNEDLRLDQRVMQFFHLINTQIHHDYSLSIDNVLIRAYVIVPLSPDVGLIQWVEGTDTFNNLISEFRFAHKQPLVAEHCAMQSCTIPEIDKLRPIQRLEALQFADSTTSKGDLRQVFWLKSRSSDAWLEKITRFARSTGLMSIVGYILGLGDRHPSNFMIDRNTGDAIHIDFGDCFELARDRIQFPELVPFRLTRMITNSFGICGIEGDFRPVCERVMMLVRENCNSLVSVLEIFVQEPIGDGETALPIKQVMPRVWDKLTGVDFDHSDNALPVNNQVSRLIDDAVNPYHLAQLYSGWCPLW